MISRFLHTYSIVPVVTKDYVLVKFSEYLRRSRIMRGGKCITIVYVIESKS